MSAQYSSVSALTQKSSPALPSPLVLAMRVVIYVPLMMAASKTADELTVASVTRGIENPTQRTSYVRIGFGIADLIVVLAFLAMFLVGQFYGEVF